MTTTASVLTRPRDVSRPVNVPTSALGYPSLTTTPAVPALLRLSAAALAASMIGVPFLLSSAPSLFPGMPLADLLEGLLVHGLVERVLILCLFGLLVAVGFGVARAGHETGRRKGARA